MAKNIPLKYQLKRFNYNKYNIILNIFNMNKKIKY